MLAWIPRFDYIGGTIQLTYPVTRWNPGARTEGRVLKSVTGVLGPSLRLRKYLLGLTLRFLEEEWPNVATFMHAARSGEPFTWYPNALDDGFTPISLQVWLESPRVATHVQPQRDSAYLQLFTLPITISRMTGPWDVEYFRIPVE